MKITETKIPGVVVVEPKVLGDHRGFFMETWQHERYSKELGIKESFVQDNLSYSRKGTLRGLHMQNPHSQGKLVHVLQGEVFDVAVDVRKGSPHFGEWEGVLLSHENKKQFYVPPGFAHGFCVISETALFAYKCTDYYAPEHEIAIQWNDSEIGIAWPLEDPLLSEKDKNALSLKDIPESHLISY